MSDRDDTKPEHPAAPPAPARLPYEPPAIVSEETFETLAMTCGKKSSTDPGCRTGGVSS